MVLSDYSFFVYALLLLGSSVAGWLAASVSTWALKRTAYRLECEIADLQDTLLREIKKRAGTESGKARNADKELLAAATKTAEPAKQEPWWVKYAMNPAQRET